MPLKAVTSGAVRAWASPHTTKQLVNNQNGTIMSLSISGCFFIVRDPSPSVESQARRQNQPPPGRPDRRPSQIQLHRTDNCCGGPNCAHQSCVGVIPTIPV